MLAAHADGAKGWQDSFLQPDTERSLAEASRSYGSKNWLSCLVMCRRATESIMETAYTKAFGKEPKGLGLNGILRSFERQNPAVIPRHWINLLDSIRNIGNVPGGHLIEPKDTELAESTRRRHSRIPS